MYFKKSYFRVYKLNIIKKLNLKRQNSNLNMFKKFDMNKNKKIGELKLLMNCNFICNV